ncbi:hypothetical protein M514_11343 [Trichuris suis]|uniref:Uncharacterized protein n=1 Tax=Trichuris suis TaxID=68888 RepID=A0A085LS47_9BILA|nr:hypothetical protein M513_11343 [Trichuris suis]KFD60472.1 hypothetical protein M514_11343 [Trichuris suis]
MEEVKNDAISLTKGRWIQKYTVKVLIDTVSPRNILLFYRCTPVQDDAQKVQLQAGFSEHVS